MAKKPVKKAAAKKAAKKAVKKAPKKAAKKVAKVSAQCPDFTNERDKKGNVILPTAQERTAKRRELQAYKKTETDPTKRTAANRAWALWYKGRA